MDDQLHLPKRLLGRRQANLCFHFAGSGENLPDIAKSRDASMGRKQNNFLFKPQVATVQLRSSHKLQQTVTGIVGLISIIAKGIQKRCLCMNVSIFLATKIDFTVMTPKLQQFETNCIESGNTSI